MTSFQLRHTLPLFLLGLPLTTQVAMASGLEDLLNSIEQESLQRLDAGSNDEAVSRSDLESAESEEVVTAPVLTPPPALAPMGLPIQHARTSCPALQQQILAALGAEKSAWSITVVNSHGRVLADVNGDRSRIPASNQKLVSTAIAIDRLGPDHRIRTELWQLPDGTLRLQGGGDPTFGFSGLRRFAKLAAGSGGSSGNPTNTPVKLQLEEEPATSWWPSGWTKPDRQYAYGAPITRLALTSNALDMSVRNPPQRMQRLLSREISRNGRKAQVSTVPAGTPKPAGSVLLFSESSKSMHHLMSLANGESHNFTAEVLLREGTGSWRLREAQGRALNWLRQQGIQVNGVRVADGSGLDRGNRLTSQMLTALLLRMEQHPYAKNYFASMAVAGERGTLRYYFPGSRLKGRFAGKTGTIRGVKAVSGRLSTPQGPLYVSMIANGSYGPVARMRRMLEASDKYSACLPVPL